MNSAVTSQQSSNTLTLIAGGQSLTGWQEVRVTRGCERVPNDFDIMLTERYPGQAAQIVVKPGDPCSVTIGADPVVTGYVDRYLPSITAGQHHVRITGRGMCRDLVDCSAWITKPGGSPTTQLSVSTLVALAQALAAPFKIKVASPSGDQFPLGPPGTGAPVQFNIPLGETGMEAIESAARYAAALAYEGTDGSLILATVGQSIHASGLVQGVNVQAASAAFTINERFSHYYPMLFSQDTFADIGSGNTAYAPVRDNGVPQFRPLFVVSEQVQYGSRSASSAPSGR